jgi:hypothetical protein
MRDLDQPDVGRAVSPERNASAAAAASSPKRAFLLAGLCRPVEAVLLSRATDNARCASRYRRSMGVPLTSFASAAAFFSSVKSLIPSPVKMGISSGSAPRSFRTRRSAFASRSCWPPRPADRRGQRKNSSPRSYRSSTAVRAPKHWWGSFSEARSSWQSPTDPCRARGRSGDCQ